MATRLGDDRAGLLGRTAQPALGPAGDRYSGYSGVYAALALIHLLFGILFLAFPYPAAHVFFVDYKHAHDIQNIELLLRLFSSLFFAGATIAWGLKAACDDGTVLNTENLRLKAALVVMAPLIIALHLLYIRHLTWWGLLLGAVAMLATMLIPLITLGMADISLLNVGNMVQGVVGGVQSLFDARLTFRSLASLLFALATLVLFLAGVAYLVMPRYTLKAVFGHYEGAEAAFLWRCLGVGLITVMPTLTYVLKEAADSRFLGGAMPNTLNAGLLVTSAVHLSIFILILVKVHHHWLLWTLIVAWGGALLAALVGLFMAHSPFHARDDTTGYEQL